MPVSRTTAVAVSHKERIAYGECEQPVRTLILADLVREKDTGSQFRKKRSRRWCTYLLYLVFPLVRYETKITQLVVSIENMR